MRIMDKESHSEKKNIYHFFFFFFFFFFFYNFFKTRVVASLPGIIVLQELSLRLSIFQFRSVSINSLRLEARKHRLTCVAGV